jgi:hypothetical protein
MKNRERVKDVDGNMVKYGVPPEDLEDKEKKKKQNSKKKPKKDDKEEK